MNKVRIAILGVGNVGSGVWKILNTNQKEIRKRSGYDIEVAKILVNDINKKRNIDLPREILTTNVEDILNDPTIEIVVELMGGNEPAMDYILRAMRKKKHVVTANKLLLATRGVELMEVAEEEGIMLYYEASVGGGIPVIHGINESLTANRIENIVGILNGTTNYILTKMASEGMSFDDALKEAQEKGYAEADPTSDVEAYDAVYKLAILASLAFGTKIDVDSIYREGITKIKSEDIEFAKEFGYTIKLIGSAKEIDGALQMRVHPAMISNKHPLSNVNDSFNAIFIKGNAIGDLIMVGRGAGDLPTGSAVVGDIISILRSNVDLSSINENKEVSKTKKIMSMDETVCEYYIRLWVNDRPGCLGEITTTFGKHEVSIASVRQKGERGSYVPLVFITHATAEGNLRKALEEIKQIPGISKVDNIIRVENL